MTYLEQLHSEHIERQVRFFGRRELPKVEPLVHVEAPIVDEPITIKAPQGFNRSIVIIQYIAAAYGLTQRDIKGHRRFKDIVKVRHIAIWLTRQLTDYSLPEIGRRFGGKDHTTVINALRRIEQRRADLDFAAELDAHIQILKPAIGRPR